MQHLFLMLCLLFLSIPQESKAQLPTLPGFDKELAKENRERRDKERAIENDKAVAEQNRNSSEKQAMILAGAIVVGALAVCATIFYMNVAKKNPKE